MDHMISVKSMLEFVENRVRDELEPEAVAEAAGFSQSHFRAVFKGLTGMLELAIVNFKKG